jgi:hypothetical protein
LKRECAAGIAGSWNNNKTQIAVEYGVFMANGGTKALPVFLDKLIEARLLYRSVSLIQRIYGVLGDVHADHIETATRQTGRHASAKLAETDYRDIFDHIRPLMRENDQIM